MNTKLSKNRFLLLATTIAIIIPLSARRTNTKAKDYGVYAKNSVKSDKLLKPEGSYEVNADDSILFDYKGDALVYLSGYDKPAGADEESFFIVNGSSMKLAGFTGEIKYYNAAGKMLTAREICKIISVPAGETRKSYIKTWDRQHSFRYEHSASGKKGVQTYTVKFTPISFWFYY